MKGMKDNQEIFFVSYTPLGKLWNECPSKINKTSRAMQYMTINVNAILFIASVTQYLLMMAAPRMIMKVMIGRMMSSRLQYRQRTWPLVFGNSTFQHRRWAIPGRKLAAAATNEPWVKSA